ncbi:MAG TPA: DUF305 domain-containing protein [Gemmatimonadaceae bacterium]|nr:DUF305 domain-containing protein [Gemmatimonadaceae bacterium]
MRASLSWRASWRLVAAGLLLSLAPATSGAMPWAPAPSAPLPAAPDTGRPSHTDADVRFMQHMMEHHAQALVMTSLVPARTTRADIRLMAERIDVSQHGEMAMMRSWLQKRGETVPSLDTTYVAHGGHAGQGAGRDAGHDAGGHEAPMPGMLTPAELDQLARATGAEFDGLFLRFMIHHHEGALTMVEELLGTPGAGQDAEIFRFASDVDADQRAEIRRLRALQGATPAASPATPPAGAPRH